MKISFFWILIADTLCSVFALSADCTWTYFDDEVVVNCSGRGLTYVPRFNENVTYLDLSHNKIPSISMKSLPYDLKHLDISWNNIRDVDKGVFGELIDLGYLDISFNRELGFASLPNITFNLNQTKILSLIIDGINCATGIGTFIRKEHLEGIRSTHLRKLSLAYNRLELFERGVIYNLPKTLIDFSIAGNKVTAGEYLIEMHTLSNVRKINMSYQYHPQVNYPYSVLENCEEKVEKEVKTLLTGFNSNALGSVPNWSMPLPPKLETLYLQSSRYIIKNPTFSVIAPNLRHVYLQDNFIMSNSGRIIFTNNTIITCDISNNLFSHNPLNDGRHMKYLNISNNRFDKGFITDTDGTTFATFTSLEVIDMSFNNIFSLPKMLFKNSIKLRYINASNNRLTNWMVDLSKMSNLMSLDLSENKITTFREETRNQFEEAFRRSNLSINLFGNGISCTCENHEFLKWIQNHKKHFLTLENYTCSTKNSYFDFNNLISSLVNLKKICASYLAWYIGCAVTLAIFFTFIISVLLVRNKWKIRYLIYKSRQRFGFVIPFDKHLTTSMHYQYDVFLSYCGRELMFVLKEVIPRLEVDKNLRLLIKDRDYIPGIPKVDSIMSSLQESKRTVCIVSKKYLVSKWRDYELNMAKVEGIKDRGSLDYVILILLPEVYNGELPNKIMDLIRKDRYIEYPMESCAYADFWDRLIKMIER